MNEITTREQSPVARPERIGQATAIEQSRAQAEVEAAVVVAQRRPRDVPAATAAMREACGHPKVAERAFFAYPKGGQRITGPSVYLARELARCWGNVQYGVAELLRDDVAGRSEMQAYAWDVQTNTRNAAIFIVPHKRDTRRGAEKLTDLREVYENNANAGARRVRECIYSVLPRWFVDEAESICHRTLEDGGGKPLAQRVADAVKLFDDLGVSLDQLERHRGRPSAKWSAQDVAQLVVIYTSLQRGEIDRDETFPPQRVTVGEIAGNGENGLRDDDPDLTAHKAEGAQS